jgi:hypothetical protein
MFLSADPGLMRAVNMMGCASNGRIGFGGAGGVYGESGDAGAADSAALPVRQPTSWFSSAFLFGFHASIGPIEPSHPTCLAGFARVMFDNF